MHFGDCFFPSDDEVVVRNDFIVGELARKNVDMHDPRNEDHVAEGHCILLLES